MLEADLSEGDLTQVTQAIQNALRPAQPAVRFIAAPANSAGQDFSEELIQADGVDGGESIESEAPRESRPRRPRSIKPPKVVERIDWDSEPSFKAFAENFDLKTDFERYLVTALWFRE